MTRSDSNHIAAPSTRTAVQQAAPRRSRRGAAFLLLVVMILLVVAATTNAFVRGAVTSRWSERERMQDVILSNSILAAAETLSDGESIDLVIDQAADERITVLRNGDTFRAQWRKGDQAIDQMNRTFETISSKQAEPGE